MPTTTLNFPPGITTFQAVPVVGGVPTTLTPDANRQVSVDTSKFPLQMMLANGFTVPATVASGATAARPTTNTVSGQFYFDTTLNKPVWRNTANNGWVDATGTSA